MTVGSELILLGWGSPNTYDCLNHDLKDSRIALIYSVASSNLKWASATTQGCKVLIASPSIKYPFSLPIIPATPIPQPLPPEGKGSN